MQLKVRLQQEHQRVLAENRLLQEQINKGLRLQEKLRLQASTMQQKKRGDNLHLTPGVLKGQIPAQPSQVLQTPPINQAQTLKAPHIINKAALSLHPSKISPQPSLISNVPKQNLKANKVLIIQSRPDDQKLPTSQTEKQPFSDTKSPSVATHDAFYSPILEKIDKVLTGIGFTEESCKERLICSMYKNPTKFSPHSNLVSAQLSR